MIERLSVGEKIVHRRYGAGIVVDVRDHKEDQIAEQYYVINIPSGSLTVHIPVRAVGEGYLRRVSSKKGMSQALSSLSDTPTELPRDYRERRGVLDELLREGTADALAQVIRDLSALHHRRIPSTAELSLLTDAKRRLAGELALVSDVEIANAMQQIETSLHVGSA